jgi:hypothetical protein
VNKKLIATSASGKHTKDMSHCNKDIFERDKAGEAIRLEDPEYPKLFEVLLKAIRTTAEFRFAAFGSPSQCHL